MQTTRLSLLALAAAMAAGSLRAQTGDSLIEPVTPEAAPVADVPPPPAPELAPSAPATTTVEANDAGKPANGSFAPLEQQKKSMADNEDGYLIKDANLNDIFQFLAKQANRQYFHNAKISSPEYRVTGHLNTGNPLQQMEELAFMYGLTLYTKGSTIYALTQAQLSQLPAAEFQYQLRYLRPTDIAQIKELIKPVLSPSGVVNFEPKTNTVVIIDNAQKIEAARNLLHDVDKVKGQIVVETKILRITSTAAERVGMDWSSTLGANGLPIEGVRSLNSMFGLDSLFGERTGTSLTSTAIGTTTGQVLNTIEAANPYNNIVLSPVQLNAVLRALAEGNLAKQVSNPTLITEDNEQATISIIDRVPIITTTASQGAATTLSSEEVRYKIDESDPTIDKNPEKHREIGISMVVTPTLLPDGTVRMRLRPRSAQITEQIKSATTGNVYPRVTESMVESLARVPDGYSLLVGGFYGEVEKNNRNKVPLLGDVPVLNFFFKSKENVKEQASLVFVVTPKSYDPRDKCQSVKRNKSARDKLNMTEDYDWVDEHNPGPAHDPNLRRGVRGLKPVQAPYYPDTGETGYPATEPPTLQGTCDSSKEPIEGPTTRTPQFSRAKR
jgi:type II secretory pathway component GspD/PulD (secretin)